MRVLAGVLASQMTWYLDVVLAQAVQEGAEIGVTGDPG
jgi:hypothetical protein